MMASHQYSAIDSTKGEIRLLKLAPNRHEAARIEAGLVIASLHEAAASYEALSYAWGDPNNTSPIVLDGHIVSVTCNLDLALRYLRSADEPRIIWVDALCIDQSNLQERCLQVLLMRRIYKCAARVLAWLGEAHDESDMAMDLIANFESVDINSDTGNTILDTNIDTFPALLGPPAAWKAVYKLLERPWWSRLWIVQEISVASKDPVVGCGRKWVSWGAFSIASYLLQYLYSNLALPGIESAYQINLLNKLDAVRRETLEAPQTISIEVLLHLSFHRHASNPLDTVYALVGLARKVDRDILIPDYSKPVEVLFKELVQHLILTDQNLDILSSIQDYRLHMLPSWVPDWTIPSERRRNSLFPNALRKRNYASGALHPIVRFSDNLDVLTARGLLIDTIGTAVEATVKGITRTENLDRLESTALEAFAKYVPGLGVKSFDGLDWFWRTILANQIHDSEESPTSATYHMVQVLRGQADVPVDFDPSQKDICRRREYYIRPILLRIAQVLAYRRFFITRQGYLGIGPASLQEDDKVCILFGGQVPFLLRQDLHRERFMLVGETYVHGLMEGESILRYEQKEIENCVRDFEIV